MFKVYIANVPVYLCTLDTEQHIGQTPDTLYVTYHDRRDLKDIIKHIETNSQLRAVYIAGHDLNAVRRDFFGQYRLVAAAGGLVRNEQGEILFIYRSNRWDLPKGKVEPNEPIAMAALREVSEETGLPLDALQLEQAIDLGSLQQNITCHTYFEKGTKVLKLVYWFHMFCSNPEGLSPQIEEGISAVRFIAPTEFAQASYLQHIFPSVRDVLSATKHLEA